MLLYFRFVLFWVEYNKFNLLLFSSNCYNMYEFENQSKAHFLF